MHCPLVVGAYIVGLPIDPIYTYKKIIIKINSQLLKLSRKKDTKNPYRIDNLLFKSVKNIWMQHSLRSFCSQIASSIVCGNIDSGGILKEMAAL